MPPAPLIGEQGQGYLHCGDSGLNEYFVVHFKLKSVLTIERCVKCFNFPINY
jgi:hypothetical protein